MAENDTFKMFYDFDKLRDKLQNDKLQNKETPKLEDTSEGQLTTANKPYPNLTIEEIELKVKEFREYLNKEFDIETKLKDMQNSGVSDDINIATNKDFYNMLNKFKIHADAAMLINQYVGSFSNWLNFGYP